MVGSVDSLVVVAVEVVDFVVVVLMALMQVVLELLVLGLMLAVVVEQ